MMHFGFCLVALSSEMSSFMYEKDKEKQNSNLHRKSSHEKKFERNSYQPNCVLLA
jgi:hypothetical protein